MVFSLLVFASGCWAFLELADEVMEGETLTMDERILLAMRDPADPYQPVGPVWLAEFGRDVTALGGVAVLLIIVTAAAGYTLLSRKYRTTVFMLAAVGGGLILSTVLKIVIDRPRPDLISYEAAVYTASFPSGHSMMAAVTYLTLAVLLARIQPQRRLKIYLVAIAIAVTIAVGVSRVYVGVHWPTDVLAGWVAGAAWAGLCWFLAIWLQRLGVVEPEE
ncbi:PA-phosphatase [Alkalilimnicola ehrlichii]|uniref:undecaprenyl-diphosphate phosphatase n=1 Tax=Alkalilimnicola ehrlichii TaxID=351052 RepID=A0A3E0WV04_9GAMM|nr:phosphatase PAP2 family protein [Alkalilimnicola ehrlichii]RFA29297.1 PA-phosphatase [Alkalilimnicola ehrlichii]RFA36810.1 PA-phosphatase [Alkalilimnicola ehrlichii]